MKNQDAVPTLCHALPRRLSSAFGSGIKFSVKPFLAFLFFLATTLILGIGMWMAVDKGSLWLLLAGVVGYIGLLTRYGCQTH